MQKTDSRISFIRRTSNRSQRGFTLVELLNGATISGFSMAGVISTFLLLGRTGANIRNYTEVEAKARVAVELFGRDVRSAYAMTSNSTSSVTLRIPDTTSVRDGTAGADDYSVTYTFDAANKLLTRTGPPANEPNGTPSTTTLVTGVCQIPGTSFLSYYKYVNNPTANPGYGYTNGIGTNTAASVREVKQIEVSFLLARKNATVATASNKVLSARFILRNK